MKLAYQKYPSKQATDSIMIFFHGYGDSAEGFGHIVYELYEGLPTTTFYFVNAPLELFPGGYGWFEIAEEYFTHIGKGIAEMHDLLHDMIGSAKDVLPAIHVLTQKICVAENIGLDRIIYAGFSQGGLMALLSGLTSETAGIVAISSVPITYGRNFTKEEIKNKPAILLTHSTGDTIVPFACFEANKSALSEAEIKMEEKILYGLDHNYSINKEIIDSLIDFSIRCTGR